MLRVASLAEDDYKFRLSRTRARGIRSRRPLAVHPVRNQYTAFPQSAAACHNAKSLFHRT